MISDVKFELAHRDPLNASAEAPMAKIIQSQSDLITGVYEGGLKTWECSLDLLRYLASLPESEWNQMRVIELGCGSGLPGIYTLLRGAHVDFQDYNEQVLELLTIPNVLLNISPDAIQNAKDGDFEHELPYNLLSKVPAEFYSGDWGHLQELLKDLPDHLKYDTILTSETIYSLESHSKLFNLMKSIVKPQGRAFVAAKTNYFGCTGSLHQFLQLVKSDPLCSVSHVYTNSDSVRREIIQIRFS